MSSDTFSEEGEVLYFRRPRKGERSRKSVGKHGDGKWRWREGEKEAAGETVKRYMRTEEGRAGTGAQLVYHQRETGILCSGHYTDRDTVQLVEYRGD